MPFRLLFFGTPAFAVPTLARLIASPHRVVGVITQPDRPRGRGHRVLPEAVKTAALAHELPVFQPERLKDVAVLSALRQLEPDLGVVAAYGRILPAELLSLPRRGFLNVHASLLPRWRGAAPVQRAILAGDTTTGVTIMRVVQALDAGPMLVRAAVTIDPNETSVELERRLADLGADLLAGTVARLAEGPVPEQPQDETSVTYAPRLERSESQIDWARPAAAVHNQIRGLQPWPLAAATLHGRRVLLLRSEVGPAESAGPEPGRVLAIESDALVVATQPGAIRIREIQPEGRPAMMVRAFLSGYRVAAGDRFAPVPATGP